MRPFANQLAKLFATAKTHKFNKRRHQNSDQGGTLHTIVVK